MKRAFVVFLMVFAMPLLAQERDMQITPWVSQVEMQGDTDFGDGITSEFEDGNAIGLSINRFFNRYLSAEASIFSVRNEANLIVGGPQGAPIALGKTSLTPITLGAQLHLAGRSRFDPYIGAGAAYVMTRDLFSQDLEAGGLGRLELEDKIGYYLNAGIGVQITDGIGIVIDGRYIPYETSSRSTTTGVERDFDLSPQLLSLGLRFRF